MKKIFAAIFVLLVASVCQAEESSGCKAFTKGQVEVKNFGRTSRVYGEMAPFNPCHKSVSLDLPSQGVNKLGEKPPVVVLLHGGGGLEGYQKSAAGIWRSEGFATLVFDAFEMNGLDSSSDLVKYKLASDSKQKLIFSSAMGAHEWLAQKSEIDATRIFYQGHSQGGHVAVNIAGVADLKNVRAVIAEGSPPYGVGFPNHIQIPLMLLYGENDKYGTEGEVMYKIKGRCDFSEFFAGVPEGYGKTCNRSTSMGGGSVTPSPLEWADKIKAQNEPLSVTIATGGGHATLFDDYRETKRDIGGRTWYSTRGAPSATREKTWAALKEFFKSKL
jgi:dienelactone hydrolase